MALVLGARVGEVFDIGETWIAIISSNGRDSATLIDHTGDTFTISSEWETQVAPNVWLQLGPVTPRSTLRLVFEAPKKVSITRRAKDTETLANPHSRHR